MAADDCVDNTCAAFVLVYQVADLGSVVVFLSDLELDLGRQAQLVGMALAESELVLDTEDCIATRPEALLDLGCGVTPEEHRGDPTAHLFGDTDPTLGFVVIHDVRPVGHWPR